MSHEGQKVVMMEELIGPVSYSELPTIDLADGETGSEELQLFFVEEVTRTPSLPVCTISCNMSCEFVSLHSLTAAFGCSRWKLIG